jgi:transcriptional regulator with XRE-family HTH domain
VISASQIRAARALLDWSGSDLAERCGISLKTLRRYEPQEGIPSGNTTVLVAIQKVFEREGIEFTGDPLVTPGVTLHLNHPTHQTDD